MNLTEVLKNLFTGTPLAALGIIAAVIILAIMAIHAFSGRKNGIYHQTVKIGLVVLAVLIAFLIADHFTKACLTLFAKDKMTEAELIAKFGIPSEGIGGLISFLGADTLAYLLATVYGVLLAPFVFFVLFILLSAVFAIVYRIVKKKLKFPECNKRYQKILSICIGALQGFIIASVILLPFISIANIADTAASAAAESTQDEEFKSLYNEKISKKLNNPTFAVVKALGGNAMTRELATARYKGEKFNGKDEVDIFVKEIYPQLEALKQVKFGGTLSENDKATIDKFIGSIGRSDLTSSLIAGLLSNMANSSNQSELPIQGSGLFNTFISSSLKVFENADKNTVKEDLAVLKDIIFILSDTGVLEAMGAGGDLSAALTQPYNETTVFRAIMDFINSNERFVPLTTALTEMSIEMLMQNVPGEVPVSAEAYSNIKSGFSGILTLTKPSAGDEAAKAEYVKNVSDIIGTTFAENNINVEQNVIDGMAKQVADTEDSSSVDADGDGTLSDAEFNDIMLNYYDSYQQNKATNP